jgi:hypothetical protein
LRAVYFSISAPYANEHQRIVTKEKKVAAGGAPTSLSLSLWSSAARSSRRFGGGSSTIITEEWPLCDGFWES